DSYTLSATTVTIPAGQSSASISVELTDPASLNPDTDYMLPLALTSVQGAKLSSNLASATVLVRKNAKTVSTSRTGEEITDRTGWSCLYGQRDCPSIINNPSAYTYWWSGTSIQPIEVSFGKTETNITGIKLNVYSTSYCARKITVYAAENPGEPYVEVASVDYPSASNQMILSWDKPEPVNAYWLRVDATPYTSNGLVPMYITVYKN
ncbi:MAG: DUF1735 domain-containing protein, partial [Muribaculaceae bacterium]|nr:DUF1735 domain-containing protein [Muribaculaceae bacterium]